MESKILTPNNMESKYKIRKSITKGDMTKELSVTEVENGFIICIEERGYKGEGEKREWYSTEKKYISKTNPLEPEKKETKEETSTLLDVINALNI